jgi:hypothetical protein
VETLVASGNTMRSIEVERLTGTKRRLKDMAVPLGGLLCPTARLGRAIIFLSRGTGHKPVLATLVRVDNRGAAGIGAAVVQIELAEAGIAPAVVRIVAGAEGIESAIAALPPAPVPGEVQWVMARAGAAAVRRVPAVRVAAPAWAPAEGAPVVADGGGDKS